MNMDMNLICNKDLTTQATVGQCECRRDMKWNTEALECQVETVNVTDFIFDQQNFRFIWMLIVKSSHMKHSLQL